MNKKYLLIIEDNDDVNWYFCLEKEWYDWIFDDTEPLESMVESLFNNIGEKKLNKFKTIDDAREFISSETEGDEYDG